MEYKKTTAQVFGESITYHTAYLKAWLIEGQRPWLVQFVDNDPSNLEASNLKSIYRGQPCK